MQAFFPIFYIAKKPRRYSVNENSSKVRRNTSCKNVGKIMQNVGSRRLTPKLQTYTLANTQNSIIINKGKDLKISKKQV